jgi:hypothetical protein
MRNYDKLIKILREHYVGMDIIQGLSISKDEIPRHDLYIFKRKEFPESELVAVVVFDEKTQKCGIVSKLHEDNRIKKKLRKERITLKIKNANDLYKINEFVKNACNSNYSFYHEFMKNF